MEWNTDGGELLCRVGSFIDATLQDTLAGLIGTFSNNIKRVHDLKVQDRAWKERVEARNKQVWPVGHSRNQIHIKHTPYECLIIP